MSRVPPDHLLDYVRRDDLPDPRDCLTELLGGRRPVEERDGDDKPLPASARIDDVVVAVCNARGRVSAFNVEGTQRALDLIAERLREIRADLEASR